MITAADERTGRMIITDLYNLTSSMARQSSDPDFLMEGVEKRQALMDEYDAWRALHPDEDITEIKQMVKEILVMDKKINAALGTLRNSAKDQLTEAQSRQKAMSYAVGNVSSSGSYMDYKK